MRTRGLGFLYQRFSSLLGDEAFQFRNEQSRTWSFGVNHGSIRDSWPIAFSGYPRGSRVSGETECPKHTPPNIGTETRENRRRNCVAPVAGWLWPSYTE